MHLKYAALCHILPLYFDKIENLFDCLSVVYLALANSPIHNSQLLTRNLPFVEVVWNRINSLFVGRSNIT